MITEEQLPDLLGDEIPLLNVEFEKLARISSAYASIQCFTDYTKRVLLEGNINMAKNCFDIAEKMMHRGSRIIQNAMSNVFLFSISQFMDTTKKNHELLMKLLKGDLRKEYCRQINSCNH